MWGRNIILPMTGKATPDTRRFRLHTHPQQLLTAHQIARAGANVRAPAQARALGLSSYLEREEIPTTWLHLPLPKDSLVARSLSLLCSPVTAAANLPFGLFSWFPSTPPLLPHHILLHSQRAAHP